MKELERKYQEYLEDWRSILLYSMKEADEFVDYLKSIGHKLDCNLKIKWESDFSGKPVVHVCEPTSVKR